MAVARYERKERLTVVEPPRWRQALWTVVACVAAERRMLEDEGDRAGARLFGELEEDLRRRLGALTPQAAKNLSRMERYRTEDEDDGD